MVRARASTLVGAASALAVLLLTLAVGCARGLHVQFFHSRDCSGAANATVDLLASNYSRCTECWDRCGAKSEGLGSFTLTGDPSDRVALNGNCIGR